MKVKLPYKVRTTLYIVSALGTPVVIALRAWNVIDDTAVTLWAALQAPIAAIAAFNVSKK